jgi:hypothetical protein
MSIDNSVIKEGSTGVTPVAGSDVTLVSLNDDSTTRVVQVGTGPFLTSSTIAFTATQGRPEKTAPNGYTQHRSGFVLKLPLTLSNGNTTVCTFRAQLSVDPELTSAAVDEIRYKSAQLIAGASYDNFWRLQSKS